MTIHQLLLILWARRKLILTVFAGTVGLALLVCLVMPRQYTASASVVLDVKSPDPIAGMVLPGLMAPGYMATQTDIIQSERVAQRVVKLLKLDENAELREKWADATDSRGSLTSWLADLLERKLDVAPSRESNVISISYANSDPAMAAAIANAFAQAYIDTTIDLRVEPARQYSHWFDTQLKDQRDRLEQAQRALSDYQQKNGILVTDERLDYESQRLNDLSAQLTQVQAQTTEFSSKQKLNPNTLPEVVQSPLISSLKTEIAQRESKLKELSSNLGENHPQYRSAIAELNELRSRLRQETDTIAASVKTAGSAGHIRESEIAHAMDLQKAKLLELRKQRDDIAVLRRDVESAQAAFDAVSQRMTQTRLEAQSVQTNVSVLTPATEPLLPSNPRIMRNLVIAAFLGTLAGIAAALVVELGQRRIRSADYLAHCLGVPVLVELDSGMPPTKRLGGRNLGSYLLPFAR
ncbi:MAG: chain length determinant protein EpsF [Rhodocyclaceae bacterium]|nr:chain length determinant protein EpsF [Rhodocyclaceae bacterium]